MEDGENEKMPEILSIRNLTIQLKQNRNRLPVLSGLSLTVQKGEIFGIVGESGCGKSVLSNSIMGLQPETMFASKGDIVFEGQSLLNKPKHQLQKMRGNEISMVFQNPMSSLNPSLTIGYQIMEIIRTHQKIPKKEAREIAIELMKKVGLPRADQLLYEYPHQLSGGMQQRVMIAIAIACQPKLLIADEPTTALDVMIQAQILKLLKEIQREQGTTIVLISHDLGVMGEMCDRIAVMYAGEIVEIGTTEQLFENPSHPYTKGLMQSIPSPDKKGKPLYSIAGTVPPLQERKGGCPFASRCQLAIEKCFESKPQLTKVSDAHDVSCYFSEIAEGNDEYARSSS